MVSMTTIALFGAGGKMGARIAALLRQDGQYRTLCVEAGEAGVARLRKLGFEPVAADSALADADAVILAVPDRLIGKIAADVVPRVKSGAVVIILDAAAPHSGILPQRDDIAYFVTHPCHPPLFNDEPDLDARNDHFGGIAKQHIVCALMQGPEEAYTLGEELARIMFAPVMNAYRLTVAQIAMLEPALSETLALTLVGLLKAGLDEVVRRGVPEDAAREFLLGHLNIELAIFFGYLDIQVSDGAKLAMQRAMDMIIQPGWQHIFEPENVMQEVRAIVGQTA
jgi:D-apionate oxidoisomerase